MTSRKTLLRCLAAAVAATGTATTLSSYAETIETIIVTSQAREQTAEEVPIAIQVVTMEQIEDLAAANLSDMNGYFPGFAVSGDQATQPNYSLRGIGTGDFGVSTDAPVGVYVDGVYTGKTGGALMNFNDIQRVEVLKGPQGTLFGRNSAAGAIAIYTNDPVQKTDANMLLRVGNNNTRYLSGMGNTAISDTTAVRFSFVNSRSDGWDTNETTGKDVNGDHAWGTRLAVKWAPSDAFSAILSWDHEDLNQTARPAYAVVSVPNGTRPSFPPTAANFVSPFDLPLQNDAPSSETRKFDGGTLRIEIPIGDMTLKSTTGYRHFKSFNREDNDGTANYLTYLDTANIETNTSWQQEFRLGGETESFDWVTGLSYFRSTADQTSEVNTNTDTLDTLNFNTVDGTTPLANLGLSGNTWQESMINTADAKAYSVYGDVIWHLTADTNLTTGLRATRDTKDASWLVPAPNAPGLGGLTALIGNQVFAEAAQLAASKVSGSHSWNDLSPRLVLDHRLSPDTMLFASVSRGYQAGGYNVFVPEGRFDPEHMLNYEIGAKNYFPDIGLTVNGSVFHYKFTDLQDINLVSISGSAVPVYVINNSDESATGVDLDVSYKLTDDVRLFSAAEYISQHYDKKLYASHFTDAGGNPITYDLSGQSTGLPYLTAMAGTNIDWQLFNGVTELTLQGTYTSQGRCNDQLREEFACLDHGPVRVGKPTTRVDAKLGWTQTDKRFGMALVVNNVFDKRYITPVSNGQSPVGGQAAWTAGTPYTMITPPRFWGLEFTLGL